jgi:hypothetical protein
MAPRLRSANALHNLLPEEALRVIMLALPVDARARAACVCRSWRAFLADASLWQVLDLTPAGGVAAERLTPNLIRGAVARAAGGLRSLSLEDVPNLNARQMLLDVIESDGAQLQQVSTDRVLTGEQVDVLFAAAPRLQVLNTQLGGFCTDLLPFLRNDQPYGPLRISELLVLVGPNQAPAEVLALAAAVTSHESLKGLNLSMNVFAPWVNTLVDVAAERRMSRLRILDNCVLDAESVPALARLLQRGSLTRLAVSCDGFPHAQEASMPVLCAALRACRTLKHLMLRVSPPDAASRRTISELLDAVSALPALSLLDLSESRLQDRAAAGRALGALLAANLPSLDALRVRDCHLGDEAMAVLLDGLAANEYLCTLDCKYQNDLSAAFVRDRLAPVALAAGVNLPA